jgi:uncharacterized protein YxeA
MKKIIALCLLIVLVVGGFFLYKSLSNKDIEITKEIAYQRVDKYCHDNYDWSISKDNPSIMYVTMGEEKDDEYQVIFRSYTGSFVNFYVNKTSGITRIMEKSPINNEETNIGTINIKDYQ